MALETDVAVIGSGVAGTLAALSAGRTGARVLVVSRAAGATALGSGALDVAADPAELPGAPWLGGPTLEQTLERLRFQAPGHPLAGPARAALPEALALLAEATDLYETPRLDRPAGTFATELGTWHRSAAAQRTQAGSELGLLAGRQVAVVGLRLWPGFDAPFVARSLAELAAAGGVPLELRAVEVDFWRERADVHRSPVELARQLEAPGGAERLGAAIRREIDRLALPVDHLLLPAVLGPGDARGTAARLAAAAGRPASELLAAPTSVPGLRLFRALEGALARAGIRRLAASVEGARPQASRPGGGVPLEALVLAGAEGTEIRARAFVLATGRFVGGGVTLDPEPRETALGLPIYLDGQPVQGRRPPSWFLPGVTDAHPGARLGVGTDNRLRPLTAGPAVAHPNLFACGDVVADHDYVAHRSGLGTAAASGHLAGRLAAAHALAQAPAQPSSAALAPST